ncbi:MAG: 2-oxo-4-hydroxy-4-carboxy-5-ureidoimidazoline decarboxylase [Gemmatimonadota bacterium]
MTWLQSFNHAPDDVAEEALLACCAAPAWARAVAARRPYSAPADLLAAVDEEWWLLPRPEWLQALAAHPRIGERAAAKPQAGSADAWSAEEQSAVRLTASTATQLADVNRAYEQKFGHTYIVCATGKSAQEMLSIAEQRMNNDAGTELRVAASEQAKITRLRLEKLLTLEVEEGVRE